MLLPQRFHSSQCLPSRFNLGLAESVIVQIVVGVFAMPDGCTK